jgi:hypothetical protein
MGEGDVAAPPMKVGFNYPVWANCDGHWIGPIPGAAGPTPLPNPRWVTLLPNLKSLANMGITVVRCFIMGNCYNYGPAPQKRPQKWKLRDKWTFDQPAWLDDNHADPDGVVRRFDEHFKKLLQEFDAVNSQNRPGPPLLCLPSIIDFHAFLDPLPGERDPTLSFRARGRGDIMEDTAKRRLFFTNVLQKFLSLATGYKKNIFAIEIMNEPHWNFVDFKPVDPVATNRVIPKSVVGDFLREACDTIEAAGFESTVGHRFYSECSDLPSGTKAQFHYYPDTLKYYPLGNLVNPLAVVINDDPNPIPTYDDALKKIAADQKNVRPGWQKTVTDVFVGEAGSRLPGQYPGFFNQGRLWPELNGKDGSDSEVVYQRLKLLSDKKYKLACVWPDIDASGSDALPDKMKMEKIKSLLRFTGGT